MKVSKKGRGVGRSQKIRYLNFLGTFSGSPKRRANKSEPGENGSMNGKVDPKLGPVRKTAGVRNLPKIERKKGLGSLGSGGDEFTSHPPLPPTSLGPKKLTGSNIMNELDPVAESPTESFEDDD